MKDYKLISKISLWVLMAIGICVAVLFFFVGGSEGAPLEVAGDLLEIPYFTTLFLSWNYALVCLVCLVTLAIVIWGLAKQFKEDRKGAISTLCIFFGFVALILLCWFLGSAEEIQIIGYEGHDNVGFMAQLSDASLYLTYTLVCATILTMCWGVWYTKRLK